MEKAHVREEASNSCPLLVYCPLRNFLLVQSFEGLPTPHGCKDSNEGFIL